MYHSHSGIQRGDGIFGAIIVREKEDPNANMYNNDLPEHVILFNDWIGNSTFVERIETFLKYSKLIT